MNPRKLLIAGAGLASFLLFLLVNVPAGVLTGLVGSVMPDNIRVIGISGTFWNGTVQSIAIDGWQLDEASWGLHPSGLLLGRLSARVSARFAGGEISTNASVSLTGNITARDLLATGPLQPVAARMKLPVSAGSYRVEIAELTIADGWPASLAGSVRVSGIPLSVTGDPVGPKGRYAAEFDAVPVAPDGRLAGTVADEGGPVEVGGTIVLMPPGNYELQIRLKSRPDAPADIARAISLAGPAGPDGRREISLAGSL